MDLQVQIALNPTIVVSPSCGGQCGAFHFASFNAPYRRVWGLGERETLRFGCTPLRRAFVSRREQFH